MTAIKRVKAAIKELKQGKMIILMDDPNRENEGDLILPAETITPENMNFMIRHSSGIVCLPLTASHLKKLALPLMVPIQDNTSLHGTPFTISIDAKTGITTGVSAADRAKTIQVAISDQVTPNDLVRPGHIFPLQAKPGGVLERPGHTEGAVDLAYLAGFKPAAVLCEVMNPDGTMACGRALEAFARMHQLTTLTIADIIDYRLHSEDLIATETSAQIPLDPYGSFKVTIIKEKITGIEHIVLTNEAKTTPPLVRLHSACATGDLFASRRCDCHQQLHHALERISKEGGVLIYLNQEGRGVGLFNKIKAYHLQEQGFDTVQANEQLGLPIDSRKYHIAAHILRRQRIHAIRLMTHNPAKIKDLEKHGLTVTMEKMPSFHHEHNQHYLKTKKEKLHHSIHFTTPTIEERLTK